MKKLMLTLMILSLFIFGLSTTALAASPAQGPSCSGNTIFYKAYAASPNGSGCLTGTDADTIFDTLKSCGVTFGGSGRPQDDAAVSGAQDNAADAWDCPAAKNTQDYDAASNTQDAAAVSDAQNNTAADNAQNSAPADNTWDCPVTAGAPDNAGTNCVTSTFDLSELATLLKSYGIYIPDCLQDNDAQDNAAAPVPDDSDKQTSVPADDTSSPADDTSVPSDNKVNASYAQQVADLVNEQRAANGLAPLTLSSELSNVAQAKSQDMHDNNYFSHTSPTYGSPFDMMTAFGISYRTAGENIAMGYATPETVVNAWMNSPGHRANILNSSYTRIGVGYVADGSYWTQEFTGQQPCGNNQVY